ncbi:MAG: hypothetical protein WDM90_22150 [Ferruginibacter sp.]
MWQINGAEFKIRYRIEIANILAPKNLKGASFTVRFIAGSADIFSFTYFVHCSLPVEVNAATITASNNIMPR